MNAQTSTIAAAQAPARSVRASRQAARSDRLSLLAGRRALLVLNRARDVVLTVRWGRIWFTIERDPGDYVLSAGDRMRIASNRAVVLEAWQQSRIEVEIPADSDLHIERASGSLCLLDPAQLAAKRFARASAAELSVG